MAIVETHEAILADLWQRLALPLSIATRARAIAAERDRPEVAAKRVEWAATPPTFDLARAKFVDETSASTNMACCYGRNLKGERLVDTVPHGHRKMTTFVAALCLAGIITPTVVDGAIDGDRFLAWVE